MICVATDENNDCQIPGCGEYCGPAVDGVVGLLVGGVKQR